MWYSRHFLTPWLLQTFSITKSHDLPDDRLLVTGPLAAGLGAAVPEAPPRDTSVLALFPEALGGMMQNFFLNQKCEERHGVDVL